jgi:hypothetical protein
MQAAQKKLRMRYLGCCSTAKYMRRHATVSDEKSGSIVGFQMSWL